MFFFLCVCAPSSHDDIERKIKKRERVVCVRWRKEEENGDGRHKVTAAATRQAEEEEEEKQSKQA